MREVSVNPTSLYKINSHIRHSRAGRALLRWRKECGWLWVQLASAVQPPIHNVAYMYIDCFQFLPVTSSFIVTCTYLFTTDDNHLQKSTILSSAMSSYRSSGHDINPSFTNFVRKIDQEITWNFCVVGLRYLVSAHSLIIHFISFEELSYVDCQDVAQYTIRTSQYILRINPLAR